MNIRNKKEKLRKEHQKQQLKKPAVENQKPEAPDHNCCLSLQPNLLHHLRQAIKMFNSNKSGATNNKLVAAGDRSASSHLRELDEKLRIKEIAEKLRLDESLVIAIRDAHPVTLIEMEVLRKASTAKIVSWLENLGFTIHTQLQPIEPYRNIGKPLDRTEKDFMQQSRSRYKH